MSRQAFAILFLAATAALAGCGGSATSASARAGAGASAAACGGSTCGSAVASLTDAAGDFLTYRVGLVSLTLERNDGMVVETLPSTTSVDFTQLVTLSEVISTAQIPAGEYKSAVLTLDFSNSTIQVDDGQGTPVTVKAIDSTGAAVGQMKLAVQLDLKHDLHIEAGKASRIAFDFNLLASNSVDLNARTVTVSPVLVATVAPTTDKLLRARGTVLSVDAGASTYTIQVKPFHEEGDDTHSTLIVHVTDTTPFEINGTPYAGAAGLAQLASLPVGVFAVAFGSLQPTDQTFLAARVLAGTSVEGGNMDYLSGSVIARSGDTITIHGAQLEDHQGSDEFVGHDATLTLSSGTAVTVENQSTATPQHTIAEISVGSRIEAFGVATKDANGNVSLDASAGRVRVDFTRLQGIVSVAAAGRLTLNLTAIDRQPPSLFDFSGTGPAAAQNSDATNYNVATGSLDLTPFASGSTALAIGFTTSFGAAPPDFIATTLSPGQNEENDAGAQLEMEWGDAGTTSPFKTLDATHLDIDVANGQITRERLNDEPALVSVTQFTTDPTVVPDTSVQAQFAISHQHGSATENFDTFADFTVQLSSELKSGSAALRFTAQGQYLAQSGTLTASRITISLDK